jgi:proteasome assembly chaperone (PAC2) family protein
MNFLTDKARKMEEPLFELYRTPKLQSPSLIVGWQTRDVGKVSSRVINLLNEKLGGQEIGEIKPSGFFPLGGAAFKNDLIQFPQSKFWACEENDLLILKSDEPRYEKYKFLNLALDLAEYHYKAKELYTVSGTVSPIAHTNPRQILAVFNQAEFKEKVQGYGLVDMDYHGEPAISSYLLWLAKGRGLPGVSLWPEVPFYLASKEDPEAVGITLSFLSRKFNLGVDLEGFNVEVDRQNGKLAQLRRENPEISKFIGMLESGISLSEEEQVKLAREVYQIL